MLARSGGSDGDGGGVDECLLHSIQSKIMDYEMLVTDIRPDHFVREKMNWHGAKANMSIALVQYFLAPRDPSFDRDIAFTHLMENEFSTKFAMICSIEAVAFASRNFFFVSPVLRNVDTNLSDNISRAIVRHFLF